MGTEGTWSTGLSREFLVKPAMDFVDAVKEFSTKNTSTVTNKYTLKNQLTWLTPA